MKKVGKVAIIARNGKLLIKSSKPQRIGTPVVDQQIKRLGKIVDVIGPVRAPYIVVNTKGLGKKLKVGDVLYLMDKQPQRSTSSQRSKRPPPRKYHKSSSNRKRPTKR